MTLYKCATIYLSHNLSQIQLDFDKISGFLTDLLYFRRFEGEHWAEARRYDLALHKLLLQGTGGDRKCKWSLIWCWQPWIKNDKNDQKPETLLFLKKEKIISLLFFEKPRIYDILISIRFVK